MSPAVHRVGQNGCFPLQSVAPTVHIPGVACSEKAIQRRSDIIRHGDGCRKHADNQ